MSNCLARLTILFLFVFVAAVIASLVFAVVVVFAQECTTFLDGCYYAMPMPNPEQVLYLPMVIK